MRKVSGSYYRNTKKVKFSFEVPSSWTELQPYQFSRIIEVLHFRKADRFTIAVSLLALLADAKNWPILQAISEVKAENDQEQSGEELLSALIPLTNFLMEEKPPLNNFFPAINLKKKKHIAPALDLSNIGFGEWCFAHQYYIYYSISQDAQWLNKLIATIYRPIDINQNPDSPSFSGDLREAFNENLIEKRSLSVASLEHHIKLGILTWFSCALNEVTETRPHVFPPAPQLEPGQELPMPEPDNGRTWLTIFRELLGPKWGTTEQLKFTNAMFILDELEERHIAFEEAKKQN